MTTTDVINLYGNQIPQFQMGCKSDPIGGAPCTCKSNEPIVGQGGGGGGALTFNPNDATAVSCQCNSCDDYFVKVTGAEEYYRCFTVQYGSKVKSYALLSDRKPTKGRDGTIFTVQANPASVSGTDLTVTVTLASGGTEDVVFPILQKN